MHLYTSHKLDSVKNNKITTHARFSPGDHVQNMFE